MTRENGGDTQINKDIFHNLILKDSIIKKEKYSFLLL